MKNFVKPAVVSLLTSRPVAFIADIIFHTGVPIFMLHRVTDSTQKNNHWHTADHLRNCLDYLVTRDYTFVSLEDLVCAIQNKQKLPVKSIIFTIDDGYIDQAEIAVPIFIEYDCPVTFFIITGMLDQTTWPWDAKVSWIIESSDTKSIMSSRTLKRLNIVLENAGEKRAIRRRIQEALKKVDAKLMPEIIYNLAKDTNIVIPDNPPRQHAPMTWDMARKLEAQGVHFAPHSASHNILSKLDAFTMKHEITESWSRLKRELSNPSKIFCYPNGNVVDFGTREIELIRTLNFKAAVSTIATVAKYNDSNTDDYIYRLPRLPLPGNMIDFIQYCSWIERARAILA